MRRWWTRWLVVMSAVACVGMLQPATAESPKIGIVIMHGKGGSPTRFVADLARGLEDKGYLVANLEMPWSGRRDYDVSAQRAEEEVRAALAELRGKGAQKVFIAGHSQGGVFAVHAAGTIAADGIVAISPGGDVSNRLFRDQLGGSVERARQLVAEGKGNEKTKLEDYEGSKGKYSIVTTPTNYLSWFEPDSAMNVQRAARAANPQIPILWIVAKNDYPALRRINIPLFDTLPRNPLTKFYEANSDHLRAPSASIDEIVRWTNEVAKSSGG